MTNVYLIYGAPLSGKTTYVNDGLGSNDLVFDYDAIMQTLTGLPYQSHNENVQSIVLDIRELIINHVQSDQSLDNVYIITTFIGNELERQLNGLNVQRVRMDADYVTCIERLETSDRADEDDVRFAIIDWFNQHYNKGIVSEQFGTEDDKRKFYTSNKWYKHTRPKVLERDNFECQLCKREGKATLDSIKQDGVKKKPTLNVHHVMELEYYPEYAHEHDNLITVCIPCHNRIHNKQEYQFKKKNSKWAFDEKW